MKRRLVWLALLATLLVGSYVAGRITSPPQPEPAPPLPAEVVTVEVVKKIEVPGPERVVERVAWRTKTVEIPVGVADMLCPGEPQVVLVDAPPPLPLFGRVEVHADKYEGMAGDELVQGWSGHADCQVRRGEGLWIDLVSEPFDLSQSTSLSTRKAGDPRAQLARGRLELRAGLSSEPGLRFGITWYRRPRFGVWGDLGYSLDPASSVSLASPGSPGGFSCTDGGYGCSAIPGTEPVFQTSQASPWTVAVGLSVALGRGARR